MTMSLFGRIPKKVDSESTAERLNNLLSSPNYWFENSDMDFLRQSLITYDTKIVYNIGTGNSWDLTQMSKADAIILPPINIELMAEPAYDQPSIAKAKGGLLAAVLSKELMYRQAGKYASKMIIVPVNIGNYHWTVLAMMPHADAQNGEIEYRWADSSSPYQNTNQNVKNLIQDNVHRIYTKAKEAVITKDNQEAKRCPNGHDCGIFALQDEIAFITKNSLDIPLPELNADELSKIREVYKNSLIQSLSKAIPTISISEETERKQNISNRTVEVSKQSMSLLSDSYFLKFSELSPSLQREFANIDDRYDPAIKAIFNNPSLNEKQKAEKAADLERQINLEKGVVFQVFSREIKMHRSDVRKNQLKKQLITFDSVIKAILLVSSFIGVVLNGVQSFVSQSADSTDPKDIQKSKDSTAAITLASVISLACIATIAGILENEKRRRQNEIDELNEIRERQDAIIASMISSSQSDGQADAEDTAKSKNNTMRPSFR